jgi:hypothetical protein
MMGFVRFNKIILYYIILDGISLDMVGSVGDYIGELNSIISCTTYDS